MAEQKRASDNHIHTIETISAQLETMKADLKDHDLNHTLSDRELKMLRETNAQLVAQIESMKA